LELNDLWAVNPKRSSRTLSSKLDKSFKDRVARGAKRPLLGALFDTVKYEFLLGGVCQLLATIFQTVSPYLLKYLIIFADEAYSAHKFGTPSPPIGRGLGLVFGILGLQLCTSLSNNHFLYRGEACGGEVRAALMTVIFDKSMRISARARAGGSDPESTPENPSQPSGVSVDGQGWSNGRIINIMSVDTYRVDQASGFFHMLWTAPIQVVITLIFLLINLTYSALAGFFFLVLTAPLVARAIRGLLRRRIGINKITDQRISITQETLQSIRFVKFLGWESSFLGRVFSLRKREILSIQKLLATRNAINAISMALPIFASMITFVVFSVTNHALNPAAVFSSLALFNNLRAPLNFLPLVLGQVIDAISSIRRIQEFLLTDDAKEEFEWNSESEDAIETLDASFTWEQTSGRPDERPTNAMMPSGGHPFSGPPPDEKAKKKRKKKGDTASIKEPIKEEEPYQIRNINMSIGRDELVAIIGSVGSGKSSLLSALAGDMRKTGGKVKIGATRAFCPQSAWIQNASVRSNIVFGQEFDPDWYDSVIDASALRLDFEQLPAGDMTEIGERGFTISGGQKQRINIARAMYFGADIILLDDPLSAVDPHVGRHIMDHGICGLLKGKCRILATHQLHFLNRCDRVIWMEDGRIKCFDTFKALMETNDDFKRLMASTSVEKEDEEKDKTDDQDDQNDKIAPKDANKGADLMTVEERGVRSIPLSVFAAYLRAAGGYWVFPLVLLLLAATQCANLATSLWLSWWTANSFHYSKGKYVSV
jgi:ATP-binding cassette, subfamily C (CFTR/MRP), member 1